MCLIAIASRKLEIIVNSYVKLHLATCYFRGFMQTIHANYHFRHKLTSKRKFYQILVKFTLFLVLSPSSSTCSLVSIICRRITWKGIEENYIHSG